MAFHYDAWAVLVRRFTFHVEVDCPDCLGEGRLIYVDAEGADHISY
jgi:hypothetical protein